MDYDSFTVCELYSQQRAETIGIKTTQAIAEMTNADTVCVKG